MWSLAELPEGVLGRLTARVRPFHERVLTAPLSGRSCVYYSITVEESAGTPLAHELAAEQAGVPFVVEDAGHRAIIDPAHALISSEYDHLSVSKAAFDADRRQRGVLAEHGLVERNWFWTEEVRYREAILGIDETVTILGEGIREPDPEALPAGIYREGGRTRLRLTGSASYPLVISDDPRSI